MTSISSKTRCLQCEKNIGQFKCEGCGQAFCIKHVLEHRQLLSRQFEKILLEHDVLQQATKENGSQTQLLMVFIKQWEDNSIEKIQQMAKEARRKVAQSEDIHKKQAISQQLESLTKQIQIVREDDSFFETELQQWTSTLEKLKQQLKTMTAPIEMKEDTKVPLIYPIQIVSSPSKLTLAETNIKCESNYYQIEPDMFVPGEKFDRCYGNAKIEQHGQLVTNGNDSFFGTEIRGKMEYTSGKHELRLRIENNPSKIWIFIGVISKGSPMGGNLFTSSSVYGWGNYNDYFLAGHRQKTSGDVFFVHIREDDIIELKLNCKKKMIRYTIERTQKSEELSIDMKKCPFPWQLYISLGGRGDQIRLLNYTNTS